MRFVRAYVRDGKLEHLVESETPFEVEASVAVFERLEDGSRRAVKLDEHELGVAESFTPTDPETGARCSPSAHLFHRLEHVADAPGGSKGFARFRAKQGREAEIPSFHDVPTTIEGIKAIARSKGPGAVPERVAQWLEFMGALSGDDMDAAGLPRLTISRAAEFDAMRLGRDPSVGSRLDAFKRQARERAGKRALRGRPGG